MPTIVELIIVDVKEGVGKDDATLKKLREGAAKGGLKRQSYGLSVEHPTKFYWALFFEDGFEPKDFKWPAEEYGSFADQLKTVSTSDFTRYFVTIPEVPKRITEAPVVETAIATLKEGVDLPKFKEAQEAVIEKLLTAPGVHGAAYGVTKEDGRDVVVLFVGWDSVEAHHALREVPGNDALLAPIYAAVEKVDVAHIPYANEA